MKGRRTAILHLEVAGVPIEAKKCKGCAQILPLDSFYTANCAPDKKMNVCKSCDNKRKKRWRALNPDKEAKIVRERVAKEKVLPNTLTAEQAESIMEFFGYACALTGRTDRVQLDHFIPIHTGFGGRVYGNIIPLCAEINYSKNGYNPFEWIKTRPIRERIKFIEVVTYLATINDMTVEEYREYVYECFQNKYTLTGR